MASLCRDTAAENRTSKDRWPAKPEIDDSRIILDTCDA
jgi:hypothetical protein